MEKVEVWKAPINLLDKLDFTECLHKLPLDWRADVVKYVHEIDKKRSLLARLMLLNLLESKNCKTDFIYNEWGKPSIKNAPYFNWSHSGNYVILAWSNSIEVGVDVELKTSINIEDFKGTFSDVQWKAIIENNEPLESFYYYWTINEALIKAVGMGLSFDLKSLRTLEKGKMIANQEWFVLREIEISSSYRSFLAYKDGLEKVSVIEKLFSL